MLCPIEAKSSSLFSTCWSGKYRICTITYESVPSFVTDTAIQAWLRHTLWRLRVAQSPYGCCKRNMHVDEEYPEIYRTKQYSSDNIFYTFLSLRYLKHSLVELNYKSPTVKLKTQDFYFASVPQLPSIATVFSSAVSCASFGTRTNFFNSF